MHRTTKTYCDGCGVTHTPTLCFNKPRLPIRPKPDLTWDQTKAKWKLANPKPWRCYLQIAPLCVKNLDDDTLTLDHVIPKNRGRKYKYDYKNLRACCVYCNGLKGSRTLASLAEEYPQIKRLTSKT